MKTINIVFGLMVLSILLFLGCLQQDKFVCNKPYIQVRDECCLDTDDNKICDSDDTTTTIPETVTTSSITTTSRTTKTTKSTTTTTTTKSTTTTIETARIYGKVIDKNTDEKYGNVEVYVRGKEWSQEMFSTTTLTDIKGYYSIEVPANEEYRVNVAIGNAEMGVESLSSIGGAYSKVVKVDTGGYQVNFYVIPNCEDNLNPLSIPYNACIMNYLTSEGYISQCLGYKVKIDHIIWDEGKIEALLFTIQKPSGTEVQRQLSIDQFGKPTDTSVDDVTFRLGCSSNGRDAALYVFKS